MLLSKEKITQKKRTRIGENTRILVLILVYEVSFIPGFITLLLRHAAFLSSMRDTKMVPARSPRQLLVVVPISKI